MLPRAIHLPELQKRITYQRSTMWGIGLEPFSFQWIVELYNGLVSAGESKQARREVWKSAEAMLFEADAVRSARYELACIPVEVKVTHNAEHILDLQMYGDRLSHYTICDPTSLTEALPAHYNVDMLKEDQVYWFHFTKSEVKKMDLDFLKLEDGTLLHRLAIPTWSVNASIVDKVLRLALGERSGRAPLDVIGFPDETLGVPVAFYEQQETLTEEDVPDETLGVPVAPQTAREKIVHFIEKREQVTTSDILSQNFCADGVVKKRLRALVKEKKIIKVKHGVYASTSRTISEK